MKMGSSTFNYKKGDGSGREVWSDGKFLVDPNTFSDSLKKDLGRQLLFPYTLLPTTKIYDIHPTPFNRSTKSIPTDLHIYVTPDESFIVKMKNVFTNETLTFTKAKQANKWLAGPNITFWPQQLSFAVWCATCGCGIGLDEKYSKVVQSLVEFHVYFTIRRVLYELGVALPNTGGFGPLDNQVDKGKYQALCKEFGVVNPDLRWTRGTNGGLGDIHAYDHVHDHYSNVENSPWFSKSEKKWPNGGLHFSDEGGSSNKVIQHIVNDSHHGKQHEWFALRKGEGITRAGFGRLNRSIEALVYCVLGSQANVRNPIIGSGGGVQEAQQEMLVLFESAVIEEDISKSISRYHLAIQNAKVKLNFAITPGTWLLPSKMLINMGRVEGYNNKLQKATYDMKFGSNDFVNVLSKLEPNLEEESKPNPEDKSKPNPEEAEVEAKRCSRFKRAKDSRRERLDDSDSGGRSWLVLLSMIL